MAEAVSVEQFERQVKRLLNALPRELSNINKKLALDAIGKVTNRLIDEGKTAEGKSLGKYSTRPMSPLLAIQQATGKGAEKRIYNEAKKQQKAGQRPGISYEKLRELNNLPVDHVTLSYTGDTLGDIGVIEENVDGTTVRIVVGSRGSKQKDVFNKRGKKTGTITTEEVLENLNDKYGRALDTELLDMSEKEQADSSEVQDELLQEMFDKYLEE
jgi:ribosomal protein L25 (general stress protein Ctc)